MILFRFFEEVVTATRMHMDAKVSADDKYIERIEKALHPLILRTSNLSVATPTELINIWDIIRTDTELLTLISFVTGYVYGNMGPTEYKDCCAAIADALTALESPSTRVDDKNTFTDLAYTTALYGRSKWLDIFQKNRWLAIVYVLSNCPVSAKEPTNAESTAD